MNKYLEGILGTFFLVSMFYGAIHMGIHSIQNPWWGLFMLSGIVIIGILCHEDINLKSGDDSNDS